MVTVGIRAVQMVTAQKNNKKWTTEWELALNGFRWNVDFMFDWILNYIEK